MVFLFCAYIQKYMGSLIRRLATCYIVHSEIDRQLISSHYDIDPGKSQGNPDWYF